MKLKELKSILQAEVLYEKDEKTEIKTACGADLMSDVLAFSKRKSLLLTGLTNAQVVRTAEMIEIIAIVFVRGKRPPVETIELAREKEISLYTTSKPLFEAAGLLYEKGLKPEKLEDMK